MEAEVSEVEVILDPHSLVLYRCQPKNRKFVFFRDFPETEVWLESTAFCGICQDSNRVVVGYKFRHPVSSGLTVVVSEVMNRGLAAAFRAMLVLDALNLVTPFTPTEMLRLVRSAAEEDKTDLTQWLEREAMAQIASAEPPEIDRVFAFLREQRIFGIYDGREETPIISRSMLNELAAFATRARTSDEVSRYASSLPALRKD